MDRLKLHRLHELDEVCFFKPRSWEFWRAVIVCFCVGCIVGHWLEIPYCLFMDRCFGIVADDYAVWTDPWYHPYWVYGVGAVVVTLVLEPFKESVLRRRKTVWGALLETFAYSALLAMVMELLIGWLVNQPDASGTYPYWDNSQMPLNIFGQAWLVNDVVIGLVAVLYIWIIYPLVCGMLDFAVRHGGQRAGNVLFAAIVAAFAVLCTMSYIQLAL